MLQHLTGFGLASRALPFSLLPDGPTERESGENPAVVSRRAVGLSVVGYVESGLPPDADGRSSARCPVGLLNLGNPLPAARPDVSEISNPTNWSAGSVWAVTLKLVALAGMNLLSPGYGPDEIPILHSAA